MKITIEVDDDSAFTMDEFIRAFNEINEFSLKDRLAPRGHSFISKDKICGTEWLVDLTAEKMETRISTGWTRTSFRAIPSPIPGLHPGSEPTTRARNA